MLTESFTYTQLASSSTVSDASRLGPPEPIKKVSPSEAFKAAQNTIYVGVGFIRVGNINVVTGCFEALFQLRFAYCEPGLRGREKLDTGQHLGGELEHCDRWDSWEEDCPNRPRVDDRSFANVKSLERVDIYNVRLVHKIDGCKVDGLVRMTLFVRGTFREYMELQDFPYDVQKLSIHLRNNMGGKDFVLTPWTKQTEFKFQCMLMDFEFFKPPIIDLRRESTRAHRLVFNIVVQRKAWFFEINVLMILGTIISISFVTFLFKTRRDLTQNLSIVLTLVLTAVTFRFSVADKLPPAAYSTVIDKYITVSFFCLAFVVFSHLGASIFPVVVFERVVFPFVGCLWGLFNVFFCCRVFMFKRTANKRLAAMGLERMSFQGKDESVLPWKILP
uniref:Neurotransmitter-gated ion-channel ligand-binding domain-containing protein n=1 Tax=Noctiluca scintillans TaxID=2966 RepID=A0A7S1AVE6_NOCSC|mmetsp:Transcript_61906/g.164517  ORF Transcript_61906/g.164517 Transcript_61906/m.164517 type:complete len:389 (+) Transcript_61906:83-1249(+)